MAKAYRCNLCTEFSTGGPQATVQLDKRGSPRSERADLCEECYEGLRDNFNLSEGTLDL